MSRSAPEKRNVDPRTANTAGRHAPRMVPGIAISPFPVDRILAVRHRCRLAFFILTELSINKFTVGGSIFPRDPFRMQRSYSAC